jgi:GGDEF domain-containing protein
VHTTRARTGRRWFIGAAGLMTAAHPLLPADIRSVTYMLVSALTVLPLISLVRRVPGRDRLPWWILLGAMSLLTLANAMTAFGGPGQRMSAELMITTAHTSLLAAAVTLVLRRGRNDIGGVLDVSVAGVGMGGVVWTALLQPRLAAMHSSTGEQTALLISVLVLVGVLGALLRVRKVAERRLPALDLLICALSLALVGNVVLALTTGSMTDGRPAWIEVFFLLSYMCVGAAPLSASVDELMRQGPAPVDGLSIGRLFFLGVALVVSPVAGGIREMAGLDADGPLLALGSLLIAALVMVRVGRLAAERQRAEAALRQQATHDQLTGLPNRSELLARLEAALDRERATGRPAVVLLFCDLNGFKAVNDRLGHLAGDQLLAGVAARIRAGLRTGETLARYGGDEFLVLCEAAGSSAGGISGGGISGGGISGGGISGGGLSWGGLSEGGFSDGDFSGGGGAQEQAALRLHAHVERALDEPFDLAGEWVRIGASVGAVISDGSLDADELIRRADQAMYAAKTSTAALSPR